MSIIINNNNDNNNNSTYNLVQFQKMIIVFYRNLYIYKINNLKLHKNKNISSVKLREQVGFEVAFESNEHVVVAGSIKLGRRHRRIHTCTKC